MRRIIALLDAAVPELERKIRERLGWIAARGFNSSDFTLRRLEANLRAVRETLTEAYRVAGKALSQDLRSVGRYETQFQGDLLARAGVSAEVGIARVPADLLRAIVDSRPFQGRLLREWAQGLEEDAFRRLRGAVRQGLAQGESVDQIVRRVRGTRAKSYADGILELSRRDAEKVVRTATAHVTNYAKELTYDANRDVIKGLRWVGTLDARTCPVCAPRDGLLYTLDYRPIDHSIPWETGPGRIHFGCRCTSAPVLKSWREMGIDAKSIDAGQRRSMDGLVPDRTTFADWIRRQPVGVQDRVLGATRARAMRAGTLDWDDLFDDRGRWISLSDLETEDAA